MPCGICKQAGHNRLTCPQKESEKSAWPPGLSPLWSPIRVLQDEIEAVNREKEDLMEQIKDLRRDNDVVRDICRTRTDQVTRLENHIKEMKNDNETQLRKDLAETLFDNKTELPDGLYLELMNKLRI